MGVVYKWVAVVVNSSIVFVTVSFSIAVFSRLIIEAVLCLTLFFPIHPALYNCL